MVRCLDYTYDCFRCGNRVHKMRYCLTLKAKGKEVNQAPYGGTDPNVEIKIISMHSKLKKRIILSKSLGMS